MADKPVDSVYAVAWPEQDLLKVGYTYQRRWRSFTARGGVLILWEPFTTPDEALAREAALHAQVAATAPRAFTNRQESHPFLGPTGDGWTECYLMSSGQFTKEIEGG